MKIEKVLEPKCDKLIIKKNHCSAIILDAELDALECDFNYDFCVQINTDELSYITLTYENLENLQELILKSERYYEKYYEKKRANTSKAKKESSRHF